MLFLKEGKLITGARWTCDNYGHLSKLVGFSPYVSSITSSTISGHFGARTKKGIIRTYEITFHFIKHNTLEDNR